MVKKKANKLERFAVFVTNRVGTMGFFLIIVAWTIIWLGWNTLAPKNLEFDPFPGFVLWLFISNMIQIFLMPLILIGQNVQTKHMESLTNKDYRLNKEIEKDVHVALKELTELLKKEKDEKTNK